MHPQRDNEVVAKEANDQKTERPSLIEMFTPDLRSFRFSSSFNRANHSVAKHSVAKHSVATQGGAPVLEFKHKFNSHLRLS